MPQLLSGHDQHSLDLRGTSPTSILLELPLDPFALSARGRQLLRPSLRLPASAPTGIQVRLVPPFPRSPYAVLSGLTSCDSSSGPGMAHAPRSTTSLPHPGSHTHHLARDLYSPSVPSFARRDHHHTPRSPSLSAFRRPNHSSPSEAPLLYTNPNRSMDSYSGRSSPSIPPLLNLQQLGSLTDAQGLQLTPEITGSIEKGFFLAENEWTCYRRNYFAIVCSFGLKLPNMTSVAYPTQPLHFMPQNSNQTFPINHFAMSISAIVSDTDSQQIELVQHTPKRDKGPVAKPEKVRLAPKLTQPSPIHMSSMYQDQGAARGYDPSYAQPTAGSIATEHTFERIQFKQATANNGKRRAAQQYYHLVVELWGDTGMQQSQSGDTFVKIAIRKSAKMIVRGRSPGHYQAERRGSTSSGPGGSSGSIGGGYQTLASPGDYGSNANMLTSQYAQGYDPRSGYGGNTRHAHELNMGPIMTAEEAKNMAVPKAAYPYYPNTMYESDQDPNHAVEMFAHTRTSEPESSTAPHMSRAFDPTKIKPESQMPDALYPGSSFMSQRCGRFEPKSSSTGYYPNVMPPSSMSMT